MSTLATDHLLDALLKRLDGARRDLGAITERQRLRAHPDEVAALALHAAVTAVGASTQLPPDDRLDAARALLEACAEQLGEPDRGWFLGQRLAHYDRALRADTHPPHARAAHLFLDMLEVPDEQRAGPATALGLMVMQYCGMFAEDVERSLLARGRC